MGTRQGKHLTGCTAVGIPPFSHAMERLSQLQETVVKVQPDRDTGWDGEWQDLKPSQIQEDPSHAAEINLWQLHLYTRTSFSWLGSSTHQ